MELVYILGGILGLLALACALSALLICGEPGRTRVFGAKSDLRETVQDTSSSALRPWIL